MYRIGRNGGGSEGAAKGKISEKLRSARRRRRRRRIHRRREEVSTVGLVGFSSAKRREEKPEDCTVLFPSQVSLYMEDEMMWTPLLQEPRLLLLLR
jgi:hypothetical protein